MMRRSATPHVRSRDAALEPELARFLAESPLDRPKIFAFLESLARRLPESTRVLDAGAGNAPYRTLFAHCEYVTTDWEHSAHTGAQSSNVLAPLDRLPLADESFDIVVNTQVLEHVPDPAAVLRELHRLLVPGGELWLTAPFVWELHEEPHDYFRYTIHGLRSFLQAAGFVEIDVHPLGGYFTTIAQLVRQCGSITGLDRRSLPVRGAVALASRLAPALMRLDPLDARRVLPLGYSCRARRPREQAS